MIKSFKCKETKKLFEAKRNRIPQLIHKKAIMKLKRLDFTSELKHLLEPPSNNLEALRGDRMGQYSIRVNKQYRICFVWNDCHAYDVEITDYH